MDDKHIQCDDLDAAVPKPKSRKPLKHENEHPARAHWTFREVFAGTGNLTKAFTRYGFLNVDDPVEIMQSGKIDSAHDILNNETYERLCRGASQPHQIWHFAFPCGSFSLLQNLNGGTRSNVINMKLRAMRFFIGHFTCVSFCTNMDPFSPWKTR